MVSKSKDCFLRPWQGRKSQAGFTMLEVLVASVISIFGLYAAMQFYSGQGVRKKSQVAHDNLAEFDDFLKTLWWKKISDYVAASCPSAAWATYFPTAKQTLGSFGYYQALSHAAPAWGGTAVSSNIAAMRTRCAAGSGAIVGSSDSGFYFCLQLTANPATQNKVPNWSIYRMLGDGSSDEYPNRAVAEVWVGLRNATNPDTPISCATYNSAGVDKSYFGIMTYTAYYTAGITRNSATGVFRFEDKIKSRVHYLGR